MAFPSGDEVIAQITGTVTGIINKDLQEGSAFAQRQLERIRDQWIAIGKARTSGALKDEADAKEFTDGLARMVENFLLALEGLVLATLQKLWDAVTKLLWGMLESALSFTLPIPKLPTSLK
jgi:hypothetical protein